MAKVIIRRGDRVSDGARALKEALIAAGISAAIKMNENPAQGQHTPVLIINWGSRDRIAATQGSVVLNKPEVLANAQDKRRTFNVLREAQFGNIPDFWTHPPSDEQRKGSIIVERHTTTGEAGAGIHIKRKGEALTPDIPLYVRYIRKDIELRVHVVGGEAVAVQQKRKREGAEQDADQALIRNYDNGWVFAVNDVDQTAANAAKPVAVEACRILGLDFGAVDMVIDKKTNRPVVLEVNTKPGLESETVLEAYVRKLTTLIPEGAVNGPARVKKAVAKKQPAVIAKKAPAKKAAAPKVVAARGPDYIPPRDSNERVRKPDGSTWKWITTRKGNRVWRQVG